MARYWVDPPQGYLYDFPKIYDPDSDDMMHDWLIDNGYPEKYVYSTWFRVRTWPVEEDTNV